MKVSVIYLYVLLWNFLVMSEATAEYSLAGKTLFFSAEERLQMDGYFPPLPEEDGLKSDPVILNPGRQVKAKTELLYQGYLKSDKPLRYFWQLSSNGKVRHFSQSQSKASMENQQGNRIPFSGKWNYEKIDGWIKLEEKQKIYNHRE